MSVPSTPSSKQFRLKGCRWSLLYEGHLPKEDYYVWFAKNIITKKCDGKISVFIGHIILNCAKFTRVIFRTECIVDWKDQTKFDYPVKGDVFSMGIIELREGKVRPEIKSIYKTQWAPEYAQLQKLDPDLYPKVEGLVLGLTPKSTADSRQTEAGMTVMTPLPTPKSIANSHNSRQSIADSHDRQPETGMAVLPTIPETISETELRITKLLESLNEKYNDLMLFTSRIATKVKLETNAGVYLKIVGEAADVAHHYEAVPSFVLENKSYVKLGVTKDKLSIKNFVFFISIGDMLVEESNKIIKKFLASNIIFNEVKAKVKAEVKVETNETILVMKNSDIFVLEKCLKSIL